MAKNKIKLSRGETILIKIDKLWFPAVVKQPLGNVGYMVRIYPNYPGHVADQGLWHNTNLCTWRKPEPFVRDFIHKFFRDCPDRGLL